MKEPKREYWQDKASRIVIIVGGIITLLIPIIIRSNIGNNVSSYSSNNSDYNNYENEQNYEETQNNNTANIFDNESFPQASCGDQMPTNLSDFPVNFYPVYADPTAGTLQYIRVNLCRDAYSMTRKDIGQRATQVASFTSYERAEQFRDFLINKVGSGEIGEPRRVERPPR
jgi:hypothetical protein